MTWLLNLSKSFLTAVCQNMCHYLYFKGLHVATVIKKQVL